MITGKLIITIVIFIVLVILINSYRRTAKEREKAKLLFTELTSRTYDLLEDCRKQNLKFSDYMGDNGNCFVLCSDRKDNIQVLMTESRNMKIRLNAEKDCKININYIGKKSFDSIVCVITSEDLESPFEVTLCNRKHRKNSLIGRSVLTNAENFKRDFIES